MTGGSGGAGDGGDARAPGVCVHGHFYQPPRENPWTGKIDTEASAAPWPNWNERIADECYAPNVAAEIHDPDGETRRRNNFASISFNVGPTLMAWLEAARPAIHAAIVAGDAAAERATGHGSAMAQAHDHLILPLATERDRRTQVAWGLADFRHRFGRAADGMWLPETAADVPTLETLAELGVRFTILAPGQAKRVRAPGGAWSDAADGFDPGRAYRQRLPSGREISLIFYDGPLAHDVAFGGLLDDGTELAARLAAPAQAGVPPRVACVATDGESYGHHHRHGEMALARALEVLAGDESVDVVTPGQWLARHPPTWEVEISAPTSWSCAHGVRRWSGGCSCGTGEGDWDYGWRALLRDALDELAVRLAGRFEAEAAGTLHEPWRARDDCAALWLGGDDERALFWDRHLATGGDRQVAARLLEMQRCALRMFTSCGWFFDDPSGLETRQVLRYAVRALDLLEAWRSDGSTGDPAAAAWLRSLERIGSNRFEEWNAAAEVRRILREDRPRVSRPVA